MNNLKNKITASVFSVLMIGSSCLSSTFAVPPKYRLPIGLKCDVSSNGPAGVAPVYGVTSQPVAYSGNESSFEPVPYNILPNGGAAGVAPVYGATSQPGEYKKNPRPPRSKRKEEVRRSLKSPVRVSSSSECINVSDGQPEGTSPSEFSARLPDSPTQEINVSNTGRPEISAPLSENSTQSREKLFRYIFEKLPKKKSHSVSLSDGERYKQYILASLEHRMVAVWPGNSRSYNKENYPYSFDIGELLVNSPTETYLRLFNDQRLCSFIRMIVIDMTDDEKKRNGIFIEIYKVAEEAVNELFFYKALNKNNPAKRYVVDNYIKNNWFLSESIKLCPSVSSYAVELSNGIPNFIIHIMRDVKKHFKGQEEVYSYRESLDLLMCLYKAFFRTLIYRLLTQDQIVETIEDGEVVHLTTGVQIDIPLD